MDEKAKIYCIGYMPCLSPNDEWQAGQLKEQPSGSDVEKLLESAKSPHAEACLWVYEGKDPDGDPAPVLIYENADDICEHLIGYSEGKPEDWFTLYYDFDGSDYTVIVAPNHDKMFHRFSAARKLFHKDFTNYKKEDVTFFFATLRIDVFDSKSIGPITKRVASREETMLGFLDTDGLKKVQGGDNDIDPRWIGPIKIGDKSELGAGFFDRKKE